MQPINLFLWVLPTFLCSGKATAFAYQDDILFCYGKIPVSQLKNYKLLVLESAHYSKAEITLLKKNNQNVLAYLSIGEVNGHAKHYEALKDITLGKNKNWNSHYLNLRKEKTTKVLSKLIDDYFKKGFTGVFFDNVDNYTPFGPQKEDSFYLVKFLKEVREKYKDAHFLQNAGLSLLDKTHEFVNGVVVESVATDYSFTDKKYGLKDKKEFDIQIKKIVEASEKYHLPFTLIEYADTLKLKNQIINRLMPYKLDLFISKINLQALPQY